MIIEELYNEKSDTDEDDELLFGKNRNVPSNKTEYEIYFEENPMHKNVSKFDSYLHLLIIILDKRS